MVGMSLPWFESEYSDHVFLIYYHLLSPCYGPGTVLRTFLHWDPVRKEKGLEAVKSCP